MNEDKLTHDERLRLEAVAQAIARNAARLGTAVSMEQILEDASTIEKFIFGKVDA